MRSLVLAMALSGCHFSIGPQISITHEGRIGLGFEGGGGFGPARINTGWIRRDATPGIKVDHLSYLVFEPAAYGGLTFGAGWGHRSRWSAVLGVHGGYPIFIGRTTNGDDDHPLLDNFLDCNTNGSSAPIAGVPGDLYVSIALGYRWFDEHEFYFTPKFGWMFCGDIGS